MTDPRRIGEAKADAETDWRARAEAAEAKVAALGNKLAESEEARGRLEGEREVAEWPGVIEGWKAKVAELERERDGLADTRFAGVLRTVEDEREAFRRRLQQATGLLRQFVAANRLEHPWIETSPSLTAARSTLAALAGEDDG